MDSFRLARPHRRFRSLAVWGVAALLALTSAASAGAATITWSNAAGGSWSNAANWTPAQVPGSGDQAVLPTLSGPYRVSLDTAPAIAGLQIDAGDPTLDVNGYAVTAIAQLDNYGTIENFSGAYNSAILNHAGGTVVVASGQTITVGTTTWNDGRIVVGPGPGSGIITPSGLSLTGSGTLFLDEAEIFAPTYVTIGAGATLTGSGVIGGDMMNYGTLECDGHARLLRIDGIPRNFGTFRMAHEGVINVNRPLMKNTTGTITSGPGGGHLAIVMTSGNYGTIDMLRGTGKLIADGGDLLIDCGMLLEGEVQRVGSTGAVNIGMACFQNVVVTPGAELGITGHADLLATGTHLLNNGTVRVSGSMNFGIWQSPDSLAIDGTGTVILEGGILGSGDGGTLVLGAGQTLQGCGTINPPFVNLGTVNLDCGNGFLGTSQGRYTNRNVWNIRSGKTTFTGANTVFRNQGTFSATGGMIVVDKGATIDNTGSVMTIGNSNALIGSPANAGTIMGGRLEASGAGVYQAMKSATLKDVTLGSSATVLVPNGGSATVTGAKFLNQGTVRVVAGGAFTVGSTTDYQQTSGATKLEGGTLTTTRELKIDGGVLQGRGTLVGSVANAGEIAPDAGGTLRIQGNYRQLPAGSFRVSLAGAAAAANSRLDVTGAATLDGSLATSLVGGFAPLVGNTFSVLGYGSVSGEFGQMLATIPAGGGLQPVYGPTGLALTMTAAVGVDNSPNSPTMLRFYGRRTAAGASFVLELPEAAQVKARVYDTSGREVANLADGAQPAGVRVFDLNRSRNAALATGVYFARIEVASAGQTQVRTARVTVLQ